MSKSSLIRHRRELHSLTYLKPKTQIECTDCGRIFTSTRGWKNHNDTWHTAPKLYICSWCDRTYLSKTRGRLHVKNEHEGTATLQTTDAHYRPKPPKEWYRPFEATTKRIKINLVQKNASSKKIKTYQGPMNKTGERLTIELPTERKQHTYRQHPSTSRSRNVPLKRTTTDTEEDMDMMTSSIEQLLTPIMNDLTMTRPLSPIENNLMDMTPIPSFTDLSDLPEAPEPTLVDTIQNNYMQQSASRSLSLSHLKTDDTSTPVMPYMVYNPAKPTNTDTYNNLSDESDTESQEETQTREHHTIDQIKLDLYLSEDSDPEL
jgi:hypothetical protein